jgi:tetratricopeptide (TPR) repeat protein
MARKSFEDVRSGTFYYEAMEALQRDKVQDAEQWVAKGMEIYPDNSWGLAARADIVLHERKHAEARDAYLRALNQLVMTREVQAILWNNIAWIDLMLADPALLEEANTFSRQALEELPWQSYVRGTRGSVLIELGQIDEGVRHVEQALRYNYPGTSKALNACYLAIAELRRRDFSKALDYIDDAKKHDPTCPLIERAVTELDQRPRLPEFDSH